MSSGVSFACVSSRQKRAWRCRSVRAYLAVEGGRDPDFVAVDRLTDGLEGHS